MNKLFNKNNNEINIHMTNIQCSYTLSNEVIKDDITKPIYIVFTNTKTRFSKVSKLFTGSTLNHVSIGFTEIFDNLYTFDAKQDGFKVETYEILKGSLYSQYRIDIPEDAYEAIVNKIRYYSDNKNKTSYNWKGLINAVTGMYIIKARDPERMFCSEFVASLFEDVDIKLTTLPLNMVKPHELINRKLLTFVKRGKI